MKLKDITCQSLNLVNKNGEICLRLMADNNGGKVFIRHPNSEAGVSIEIVDDETPTVNLFDDMGNLKASISSIHNNGFLQIKGDDDKMKLALYVDNDGEGDLVTGDDIFDALNIEND